MTDAGVTEGVHSPESAHLQRFCVPVTCMGGCGLTLSSREFSAAVRLSALYFLAIRRESERTELGAVSFF